MNGVKKSGLHRLILHLNDIHTILKFSFVRNIATPFPCNKTDAEKTV